MKKITYPAALIRAAQAAQATNDVRYYLNGILLAASGVVAGTDGHILFRGMLPDGASTLDDDVIVKIDGKVPAAADEITFIFEDDKGGMCRTNTKKAFTFELIDGRFPDTNRVIPSLPRTNHSSGVTFNATLFGRLPDIFGKNAYCSMYPGGENDLVLVEYHESESDKGGAGALKGSIAAIMPMKAQGTFETLFTHDAVDQKVRETPERQQAA